MKSQKRMCELGQVPCLVRRLAPGPSGGRPVDAPEPMSSHTTSWKVASWRTPRSIVTRRKAYLRAAVSTPTITARRLRVSPTAEPPRPGACRARQSRLLCPSNLGKIPLADDRGKHFCKRCVRTDGETFCVWRTDIVASASAIALDAQYQMLHGFPIAAERTSAAAGSRARRPWGSENRQSCARSGAARCSARRPNSFSRRLLACSNPSSVKRTDFAWPRGSVM